MTEAAADVTHLPEQPKEPSLVQAACFSSLQLWEGLAGSPFLPSFWKKQLTPPRSYQPGSIGWRTSLSHFGWLYSTACSQLPELLCFCSQLCWDSLLPPWQKTDPKLWNSAVSYFHLLWLQQDRLSLLFQSSPSWTSSQMCCLCRCLSRRKTEVITSHSLPRFSSNTTSMYMSYAHWGANTGPLWAS